MEKKKNTRLIKSYYLPIIATLVVICAIVALTTSVTGPKKKTGTSVSADTDGAKTASLYPAPVPDTERALIPEVTESDKTEESVAEEVTEPETEPEPEQKSAAPTFCAPVSGVITKGFSDSVPVWSETMNDYRVHAALDVSAELGEAILSPANGKIGAVWDDPMMGKCMTVVHDGETVSTFKGIDEKLPDGIAPGVEVAAGQCIASVGETALAEIAEEPHVHYEMTVSGVPVDPQLYMTFSQNVNYEE